MGNKISHEVNYSFIKNQRLLIYTPMLEQSLSQLNWDTDRIFIVPDDSFIWRWIEYYQVKFRAYYLIITI